jgi:hypothetical protein
MAEVVAFPKRDQDKVVWRCNCGCMSFTLRADGEAECAHCGGLVTGDCGDWRAALPVPPLSPPEPSAGDLTVAEMETSAASLRRALRHADADTTAMVIIVQRDGGVSTWGANIETAEQAEWFDRRAETAKKMLTKASI